MRIRLDLPTAAIADGPAAEKLREVSDMIFGRGPVWDRLRGQLQQNIREILDGQEVTAEAPVVDGG